MPRYYLSDLLVDSDLELHLVSPARAAEEARAQVTIRAAIGRDPKPDIRFDDAERLRTFTGQATTIQVMSGLSFRISGGSLIEVFQAPEVTDADVSLFLIGTALGILCHQRGLLPLHCSAVGYDGRTFAFTGETGMGKSTLAAGLALLGCPHVTDDVMIIDPHGERPRMAPLPKGLKLCHDAAAHLGLKRGVPVSSLDDRKSFVSLPGTADGGGQLATALYVLAYHDQDDLPASIERLLGAEAWRELYRAVYRVELLPAIAPHAAVAARVAATARHLPLYRFTRPRSLARFDAGLDALTRHMYSLVYPSDAEAIR